jgi:hypothetical protein
MTPLESVEDRCLRCSGQQEQINNLKTSDTMQWAKLDALAAAIGTGKNWIISILVVLSLNLLTALATAIFLISRGGHA